MSSAIAEPLSLVPAETKQTHRSPSAGPGWFDSSWELRSGLHVKEGWPGDTTLHGRIDAWLQLVAGGGGGGLSLSAT
jgi:hypothetical protein